MTSFPQFTKQNLLLALETAKEDTDLYGRLFENKPEGQEVNFYEVTKSYLKSLEDDIFYTFEQLFRVFHTQGEYWYAWHHKALIWTFLAQYTLTRKVWLANHSKFVKPNTLLHDILAQYKDKKGRLKRYTTVIEGDLTIDKPMFVAGDLEVKGNLYLADNGETQAELVVLGSLICRKKIEKTTWAGTHIICGRNLEAKSIALYSNYLGIGGNLKCKAIFQDMNDTTIQVLGDVESTIWLDEDITSDSFLAGKVNIEAFCSDSLKILYEKPENGAISQFLPLFKEKFLKNYRYIDCSFDGKEEIYENPNASKDIEETVEFKDFLLDAVANYTKALQ